MHSEIQKLLDMSVIEKSEHEYGEIISPIFFKEKPDGSLRLILNLKKFNESVEYVHYKMESLSCAVNMMNRDCYMASVDLRHAYYSVPVHSDHQKFLKFIWDDQLYAFTCLPNGLTCAPRYFTKLLKPVYASLRSQGYLSVAYIDDCYLQGNSSQECAENVSETVKLVESLGFIIHPEKSVMVPSKKIKFLGFYLNSENMTVYLTEKRATEIKQLCTEIRNQTRTKIRHLASVIGKLTASFPGVIWGPLFYRKLERDKILALKANGGNYDKKCCLSDNARRELDWWIDNVENSSFPVETSKPEVTLITDASGTGWGAVCEGVRTHGFWNPDERKLITKFRNISALELLGIFYGLKSFQHILSSKHVRVLTDNTPAIKNVNKMGGSRSDLCNEVANKLWIWCKNHNIWVSAAHIPGKKNVTADAESRKANIDTEWQLNTNVFTKLTETWGPFEIDLFASRLNYQVKPFVSWKPDPESDFIDAFLLSWNTWFIYVFPPFSIIQRVLLKWKEDQAEGVMVVPLWRTAFWFPQLLRLLIDYPILLPKGRRLLQLHDNRVHPLCEKLELLACRLSGNPSKHRTFMEKLRTSSSLPGESPHRNNTPLTFVAGKSSVLQGISIPYMQMQVKY